MVKRFRTARDFGGKRYQFVNREYNKVEINRQADNLRRRGYLARVTHSDIYGYELWARKKK